MVTALVIVEAIVIVLLAILVAGLLRSHAEILRRLHELGAGDDHVHGGVSISPPLRPKPLEDVPGPAVVGLTPQGVTSAVALADSRGFTMLAFLSSGCGTCERFWEDFGTHHRSSPRTDVRTVIVTKSASDESLSEIRRLAPEEPVTIMSSEAWEQFAVPYTPYFVLVDTGRGVVVGDGAAAGWDQLVALVDRALGDQAGGDQAGGDQAGRDQAGGDQAGGDQAGGLQALRRRPGGRSMGRGTGERLVDTDEELRRAGISPGDPVLYRRPTEDA